MDEIFLLATKLACKKIEIKINGKSMSLLFSIPKDVIRMIVLQYLHWYQDKRYFISCCAHIRKMFYMEEFEDFHRTELLRLWFLKRCYDTNYVAKPTGDCGFNYNYDYIKLLEFHYTKVYEHTCCDNIECWKFRNVVLKHDHVHKKDLDDGVIKIRQKRKHDWIEFGPVTFVFIQHVYYFTFYCKGCSNNTGIYLWEKTKIMDHVSSCISREVKCNECNSMKPYYIWKGLSQTTCKYVGGSGKYPFIPSCYWCENLIESVKEHDFHKCAETYILNHKIFKSDKNVII